MKRSLIALAALAVARVATAQSSVSLFGTEPQPRIVFPSKQRHVTTRSVGSQIAAWNAKVDARKAAKRGAR